MKIALIGYGRMGRLIHRLAEERGHEIAAAITSDQDVREKLHGADVAIDFSTAEAVFDNVEACVRCGVPLVEGTTGWLARRAEVERVVVEGGGAMVEGSNFSLGVNIFYKVAEYAASLFANFPEYEAFIEEQHHSRKKDAPSGTALELEARVKKYLSTGETAATRAGNIPGTHRLGFDGPADQILIEHAARSREGFAYGAIAAAEWVVDKKGVYRFSNVVDEMMVERR